MSLAAETLYGWFMGVEFFPVYFQMFHVSVMVNLYWRGSEGESDTIYRVFSVSENFGTMHGT